MKRPGTPFPTSGYYGPDYFCNRKNETQTLLRNVQNGQSTTLVSIRRMGKTGLIQHVFHQLPKPWVSVYLDVLYTENRAELLNALATAVVRSVPERGRYGKKIWQYIKSLKPVFSYDDLTGLPQVSFQVHQQQAVQNITGIIHVLEQSENPVVIAMDEFQQITNYPEKNTDAWLRSIFQHLKNVVFIYAGSQQHVIQELFTHPSRPFYRSSQFLKLNAIDTDEYTQFIQHHFTTHQRTLTSAVVHEILRWTRRHTYYVQLLLSRIYQRPEKTITTQCWQEEADKLLKEQQYLFFQYRDILTKIQWNTLQAIAAEGHLTTPTAQGFIQQYNLGSSASVLRAMKSLLQKELVYFDYDEQGQKYYRVYDLLFERWVQKNLVP